jgi:hypothetical protein
VLVSAGSEKDREWPPSAVFPIKKQTEKTIWTIVEVFHKVLVLCKMGE